MNKRTRSTSVVQFYLNKVLKLMGVFSVMLALGMLILPGAAQRVIAGPTVERFHDVTILVASYSNQSQTQQLDLATRLACRQAIEEVYWNHRIWPVENETLKPSLEAVLPAQALQAKVEDELRLSNALEQFWQRPITGEQLQAEIDRMVGSTRQPEVLAEIFSALGDDPFLVAECLARPALTSRLIHSWFAEDEQPNQTFDQWWQVERENIPAVINTPEFPYSLDAPEQVNAQDDTWTPTPALPEGVQGSTAVWTGSEMIIWGGFTNSGARYNPATDTWTSTVTIGAPSPRRLHTAVWSGSEMIVWGGCDQDTNFCDVNSGGKYDPITDSWTPTSLTNAPVSRMNHTAVWTGNKMIVWAGCSIGSSGNNYCNIQRNDGGVYDPASNSWQAMSLASAPDAREHHQAVWADGVMVIWGGYNIAETNTGGRYNPTTNTWQATSLVGAPTARANLSMVWTGNEVIVWGGCNISLCIPGYTYFNTGGRYDPLTDTWTATNLSGAPEARGEHSAVWTGTQMIIWGGRTSASPWLDTGSRYTPATDSWEATTMTNAPAAKTDHHAVWTGDEMIIWGGYADTNQAKSGGRYDPASNSWVPTNTNDPVFAKERHTAVWTGTEMLIWGGSTRGYGEFFGLGIRFDAVTGTWSLMSTQNEPAGRYFHSAVWTGSKMVVWGGQYGTYLFDTGGQYDPISDSWTSTSLSGAPIERAHHAAVWSGNEMLIWGGATYDGYTNTGSRYDPSSNTWSAISLSGAPSGRGYMQGAWSGDEMIVWGGVTATGDTNSGGFYNPTTDTWTPTGTTGAPTGRHFHTILWTGTELIVWGGMSGNLDNGTWYNTGGRYDPGTDTWSATSTSGAPTPRIWHVSIWTGEEMIVWGGCSGTGSCPNEVYTGGRYDPASDSWMSTSIQSAPSERSNASAIWTGSEMLVWGGLAGNVGTYTTLGGFYHVTTAPNSPPVAAPDSFNVDEDMVLDVAPPGVLANDIDSDGDMLGALLASNPTHGSLVLASNGGFNYTPDANFNGSDSFTYRASDGKALSNLATVSITVNPTNDTPLAAPDAYVVVQEHVLVIPAAGVLINDSDIDGDVLSAIAGTPPAHGVLVLNSDGSFTYTPDAGYSGSDQFSYQASDGSALSQLTSVDITIEPTPPPPGINYLQFLPFTRK